MKPRKHIKKLPDIPNIGPVMARNLITLGILKPVDLIGSDPYQMYKDLCNVTHKRQVCRSMAPDEASSK